MITRSRGGNRCWALRKLSRNRRLSRFRATALGTCLRAIANPRRGHSPCFRPIRIVRQASAQRKLSRKTWLNSTARVNLSRRGKDSAASATTLRRETRSAFRATRLDHTSAATGLHARTKTMRPGTLNSTGLKCTFHVKRLGSLLVAFNKARQCTCRQVSRQYLIAFQ